MSSIQVRIQGDLLLANNGDIYPPGPPLQRMVVGDSLPSPILPPLQPQQRLVEGENDIEVLHIQPPVLPAMPGLPAQPPPPGGREVEGESRPPVQSQPPLPREPIIDGESEPGPSPARPTVPGNGNGLTD